MTPGQFHSESTMEQFILGIDQGTTGTSVCLMNSAGQIIHAVDRDHEQYYPHPGWVEQNPLELWQNAYQLVNQLLTDAIVKSSAIVGVGIANQGESVMIWDRHTGQPLHNAVIWQDTRTQADIDKLLKDNELTNEISRRTGLLPDSYFSASKIRWLIDHTSNFDKLLSEGRFCCGTLDTWLIWNLTEGNSFVTDVSTASRTLLLNIHSFEWDPFLLDIFNIPPQILPSVQDTTCHFGMVSHRDVDLSGVPILASLVDQPAAMVGQGCLAPGNIKATYGTGCFVNLNTGDEAVRSKNGLLTLLAWRRDGSPTYGLDGGILTAGATVNWLSEKTNLIQSADEIDLLCSTVSDSGGVIWLPAQVGLGAPYWERSVRGAWLNLDLASNDREAYLKCEALIDNLLQSGEIQLPNNSLTTGHNTKQAKNYNFNQWKDFFNVRQLLALSWLNNAIIELPYESERNALLALFSGILEFNNMFASYKGEGTGAVRHMFSHHVLKPERVPIEANVWGTPKSSGAFSRLYKTRLLRALDYRENPFEVGIDGEKKIYGSSLPIAEERLATWNSFEPGKIALSCGDSSVTNLPEKSIDVIVTDPPFFDNVHYSELADFFFSWQTLYPHGFIKDMSTTRSAYEVQDSNSNDFSKKLETVFSECHRILKTDGLLVFTYHHSRPDGWEALAKAIWGAGFYVVQSHPVYAELSAATPKAQAREPILIDAVIVCRKKSNKRDKKDHNPRSDLHDAIQTATRQLDTLSSVGFNPTKGDKFVASAAQFLTTLGEGLSGEESCQIIRENQSSLINMALGIELNPSI